MIEHAHLVILSPCHLVTRYGARTPTVTAVPRGTRSPPRGSELTTWPGANRPHIWGPSLSQLWISANENASPAAAINCLASSTVLPVTSGIVTLSPTLTQIFTVSPFLSLTSIGSWRVTKPSL